MEPSARVVLDLGTLDLLDSTGLEAVLTTQAPIRIRSEPTIMAHRGRPRRGRKGP